MPRLRAEDLVYQESDGETVLLDLQTSTYLVMNPTGTLLLPALAEGATREALLEKIVSAFEVDPDRATSDLDSFLSDLAGRGLLDQA